jgi:hypothetical protein
MGSVLKLDYEHISKNSQIDWSGLEKLDSGTELDSRVN